MTAKRVLTSVHRWVGLSLAILVLVQASTGLLLVNKGWLEPLLHPGVRVAPGPAASLDRVAAALAVAQPSLHLDRIYTPQRPDRALTARMLDGKRRMSVALVDPSTARVISTGPLTAYPLQFAERVHVSLLQGAVGQIVLLAEGLGLLFMAVSGLIVWWPRLKALRMALTIHTDLGARRLWRDLHLVPGALAAVFIGFSAATGAGVIAEPLLGAVVGLVAPVSPPLAMPKLAPVPGGQVYMPLQGALDILRARFPDGRLRQIRVIGADQRLMGVVMESPNTLNPRAHHLAAVDRADGRLVVWSDGDHMLAGDAALAWLLPAHTGELLGPGRLPFMSVIAGTLGLLTVSGVWMWLSKPRRRRAAIG